MTRSLGSETGFEANPIHPVADDGQPRGRNRCQSKIWGNATGRWEPDELRGSRPVVCPDKASTLSRRQTCQSNSQKLCS